MKKIIVAPLNWGLGHATRCVPIIHFLLENNFVPILASDGKALTFLQKEFPNLESLELSSYNISYTKKYSTPVFKVVFYSSYKTLTPILSHQVRAGARDVRQAANVVEV